jgi:peroxiredoxin
MRKQAVLVACAVALSAAAVFAVTPRPVADLPIRVRAGMPIDLKQYRGKVVLVAVISKDCEACIMSLDVLNRAQKDFGPKGFQVIAAIGDPNAAYLLAGFIKKYHPSFPVGFLDQDQIIRLGDFDKKTPHVVVPIFLFIDRKGTVRQQLTGDDVFFKTEEASTRKTIQDLLKP